MNEKIKAYFYNLKPAVITILIFTSYVFCIRTRWPGYRHHQIIRVARKQAFSRWNKLFMIKVEKLLIISMKEDIEKIHLDVHLLGGSVETQTVQAFPC